MQDRPTVDELLDAVAGVLHGDVMSNTTGRVNFHARVAGNVLQMLRRELREMEGQLIGHQEADKHRPPCARPCRDRHQAVRWRWTCSFRLRSELKISTLPLSSERS